MVQPPKKVSKPRGFLARLIGEVRTNLWRGIRALATPKGLLALVPLLLSAVAFAKASYSETRLSLLLNEPLRMEVTLYPESATSASIGPSGFSEFEFLLLADGKEAIYVQEMSINVVEWVNGATFDASCSYHHAWIDEGDGRKSSEFKPSYTLGTKPLSRTYSFEMRSGVVVSAASVLPLAGSFVEERDTISDQRISESLRATRLTGDSQRVMELVLDGAGSEVAACVAGVAFIPGGPHQSFIWSGDTVTKTVFADADDHTYPSPPTAPGGKEAKAMELKRRIVRIPALASGVTLFSYGKWTLF